MCALTFTARKIAPLVRMLGSPVDGEALAACRAIGRTLDSVGRDWRLEHLSDLRPVERRFLRDIKRWRGEPTPKQMKWLLAIAEALGVDRRVS